VPARGVPLAKQLVYDLGDPIVDRVAEAGQEFLIRRRVRAGSGWAATRRRLAAVLGRAGGVGLVSWGPGGSHRCRPSVSRWGQSGWQVQRAAQARMELCLRRVLIRWIGGSR
jgi:hypothetical protein